MGCAPTIGLVPQQQRAQQAERQGTGTSQSYNAQFSMMTSRQSDSKQL